MQWEEKVPNGKLVCFSVKAHDGRVTGVKITGDFFLHPEDTIYKVEEFLTGIPANIRENEVASMVREALGDAQLIGATPEDFARIFKRAVSR